MTLVNKQNAKFPITLKKGIVVFKESACIYLREMLHGMRVIGKLR